MDEALREAIREHGFDVVRALEDLRGAPQIFRDHLLFGLFDRTVVGPILFPGDTGAGFVLWTGRVVPGRTETVAVQIQSPFQPRRLVILEPLTERIEREVFREYAVQHDLRYRTEIRGFGPWKKFVDVIESDTPREVLAGERVVEHRVIDRTPRGLWTVETLFFGNMSQFMHGEVSGDAFGPDGTIHFRDNVMHAGMVVTAQVRHAAVSPIPWRAILLGEVG